VAGPVGQLQLLHVYFTFLFHLCTSASYTHHVGRIEALGVAVSLAPKMRSGEVYQTVGWGDQDVSPQGGGERRSTEGGEGEG